MNIIDVPKYDEEGNIVATLQIPMEQAQVLLQFALNFMAAVGVQSAMAVAEPDREFDD